MTAERDDNSYLWDMLMAARAVESFVRGRTVVDYLDDLMLRSAVERQIEIIGEAARHISAAFQAAQSIFPGGRSKHNVMFWPTTMARSDTSESGEWPRCVSRR
jgi:hypothetical protein